MSFEKGIISALATKATKPEIIIAATVTLGLTVLSAFGIQRMSVYWGHKEEEYYNPNYASVPGNIDNVVIHATFGFLTFLMVPLWMLVAYFFSHSKCAMYSASILTLLFLIATVATVPLIKKTVIGSLSGTPTVLAAVIWALWWIICCIASGVQYFRGIVGATSWSAWSWWIRFMGMTVFGFALTPIFYALRGNVAGSGLALIPLLLVHVVLSEWIVRRGVNNVEEQHLEIDETKQRDPEH